MSFHTTAHGSRSLPEAPADRPLSPLVLLLRGLVHAYRLLISPVLGPSCRFAPSCSAYALDALAEHGALRGGWLALRRLLRCHPWGGCGYDPVPPAPSSQPAAADRPGSRSHPAT